MISEKRILQISNDISENMCRATSKELIEVVRYFRDEFDDLWRDYYASNTLIATGLIDTGTKLLAITRPTQGKE